MPKDKKIYFADLISVWRWRGSLTRPRQMRLQRLHFMPQISRSLTADSHDVYHSILALCDLNQSADPEVVYSRLLKRLANVSKTLHHWGRSLPNNPHSLIWISWSYLNSDKHILLTPLIGYTEMMLHYSRDPSDKHFHVSPQEETLLQQCRLKARRISKNIRLMCQFALPRNEGRMCVVAPHIIARTIWGHLTFSRRFTFVALLPTPLPKLPDILFIPPDVDFLMNHLFGFGHEFNDDDMPWGEVYMHLRQAKDGAEFCFTMKDYRLMPAVWDQVSRSYEGIYELGGSIEPLVWDEGYGQGVIVRLPWAKETP